MKINQYIDHTTLKTNTTKRQIATLCEQAIKYNFYSVCINPYYLEYAQTLLKHQTVKLCTVIGFPLGQNTTSIKLKETENAISNGADEIDVVMNIGALFDKNYPFIINELTKIKNLAKERVVKVIIETYLLSNENKKKAVELIIKSKCNFVKTSTGFLNYSRATIEDIKLLFQHANNQIKVKASGGIDNREFALQLIDAGAARIGSSKSINLLENI